MLMYSRQAKTLKDGDATQSSRYAEGVTHSNDTIGLRKRKISFFGFNNREGDWIDRRQNESILSLGSEILFTAIFYGKA